jgi:hypothetical protein
MRSGLTVIPESFAQGYVLPFQAECHTLPGSGQRHTGEECTENLHTFEICGTLRSATTGYDYITGLGSPQANNIIAALANVRVRLSSASGVRPINPRVG